MAVVFKQPVTEGISPGFRVEKSLAIYDVMFFSSVLAMVATTAFLWTSTPQQIGWTILIVSPPIFRPPLD